MGGRVVEMDLGVASQPPVVLGLVGGEVVQDDVQFGGWILGHGAVHEVHELPLPLALVVPHLHSAGMHLQGSEEGRGTVPLVLMGIPAHCLPVGKSQPSLGAFQGLNGRLFIHTDDHGVLGGSRYSPTMSAAFWVNWGSVLTHQLRRRCRWMLCLRSTPQTWSAETFPSAAATSRPVHVVYPSGGGWSNWAKMHRSVVSSYTDGFPGRAASANPASPCCANRVRHLLTVAGRTCNRTAISFVVFPAAASSTIRSRCTIRCSVVVLRTHVCNVPRSSSVS